MDGWVVVFRKVSDGKKSRGRRRAVAHLPGWGLGGVGRRDVETSCFFAAVEKRGQARSPLARAPGSRGRASKGGGAARARHREEFSERKSGLGEKQGWRGTRGGRQ